MRRKKHSRGQYELELTTCSDIMFTLLIFYILIQSYVVQFPASLPELQTGQPATEKLSKTIEILEDSSIIWDGKHLGKFNRESINRQLVSEEQVKLLIAPESTAPAGILVELLDQLRLNGVSDVAFGGKPKSLLTQEKE